MTPDRWRPGVVAFIAVGLLVIAGLVAELLGLYWMGGGSYGDYR